MIYYIAEFDFGEKGKHEVGKRNIISYQGGIISSGDISKPYYGIVSNSANISFLDTETYLGNPHKILYFLEKGFAYEKVPTTIYIYNSLTKNKQQVAKMFAEDAQYNFASNVVTFTLKDGLEELQNIPIDDSEIKSRTSLKAVYEASKNTAQEQTGFEFDDLDEQTSSALSKIRPYYSNDGMAKNYWAYFDNICKAGLCQMYVGTNGKVKLVRGV